jgi:hypothetical protein
MIRKTGAAALAALFLCGPACAMSAAEFLAKADALKAKGMMAMFSSDLRLLKSDFTAGAKAWRQQAHKPNACPPAAVKLNPDEIYGLLAAVPPAQRATTTSRDAIVTGLNRRYPCR